MNMLKCGDRFFYEKRILITIVSDINEKFYIEKGKLEKYCSIKSDSIIITPFSSSTIVCFLSFLKNKYLEEVFDKKELEKLSIFFGCRILKNLLDNLDPQKEIIASFAKKSTLLDIVEDISTNKTFESFGEEFEDEAFKLFLKFSNIYFENDPKLYERLLKKFMYDIPVIDQNLQPNVKKRIFALFEL